MGPFGSILLYVAFALLAMVGAYLALASTRSRRAGLWAALATALFFVLLYFGLASIWKLGEGMP